MYSHFASFLPSLPLQVPVHVFDVWADPDERHDLAASRPDLVAQVTRVSEPIAAEMIGNRFDHLKLNTNYYSRRV